MIYIVFIGLILLYNIHKISNIDILVRIIIFGILFHISYNKEKFNIQCYPGTQKASPEESISSITKGWCTSNQISDSGAKDHYLSDNSDVEPNEDKITKCHSGVKTSPDEAIISNTKAWCKDYDLDF